MRVMSRAAIQPLRIGATAPETLSIVQQHLLVAEEQTEGLIQDMGSLGVPREQLLHSPALVRDGCQRPVSPVRVWQAVGGRDAALWQNCEALMSRMCRLESILHSLKLATFRLETERQLDPSNSARVMEQLSALQKESQEEQREARKELLQVQDQLWQACQEREEALEEAQKLREELEVATTSKMDVALAAEELKVIKVQMTERLFELKVQLSQEADLRLEAQRTHDALLQRVKEMEGVVEMEREQVQVLQTDCQAMQSDRQGVRQALKKEAERASLLEKQSQQLRDNADVKDSIISQLTDELKSAHLALQRLQQENSRLQKDEGNLKTAAERVQVLNVQLQGQCTELNGALRSLTVENARLLSAHQAELKAERERVLQQLQEQDLLLDAARRNIQAELQGALKERLRLQQDLDVLRRDHQQLQQSSRVAQETSVTQRERLESAVVRLRAELSGAGKDGEALKRERHRTLAEMQNKVSKLEKEKSSLQTQLTKAKSRVVQLQIELNGQTEHKQQEKRSSILEKKYAKASAEVSSSKLTCHQLEQNLSQAEASLRRKEEELALARAARDDALRDKQALRDQMENLQDLHRSQLCQLEEQLGARRQDGEWVTQTLHGMLESHARLQDSSHSLQAQLGGREGELTALREERAQLQQHVERLQTHVERLQHDLLATDAEMEPLRKALETVSVDNKQLAHTLEQALLANNQLVGRLGRTQDQQENIQSQHQQLLSEREAELKDTREEVKWLTDHLDSVKEQLRKDSNCQKRASHREVTELKKAVDEATSRSGDLSRANRELREKVGELEKVVSNQKARIKDLTTQLKQFAENRAVMASSLRMKEMEGTLKGLESLKDEYQRRNNEQSQLIQQFQSEMQRLASSQEGELETEREHRQVLQDKCERLEENTRQLRRGRDEAEERLREASVESQQITENLIEAHSWFRSNFNSLKKELEKSKRKKEQAAEKLGSLGNAKEGTPSTSTDCENEDRSGPTVPEPRPNYWTATVQRWETKRELARISEKYRRRDRPTHRQTDK
ncbi:coiled-coil domain-containing protein 150 [Conger conger]|uniref:coiled-coil domain-containing protein 150 n=1 Tax=Conger conger TaxID=82655 RepID=UPI002A5A10C0|nr:coiled-coil domain-containing protein 150 [Conger conger]